MFNNNQKKSLTLKKRFLKTCVSLNSTEKSQGSTPYAFSSIS